MKYIKRKKMRLQDYDYASNGAYFVTVCTQDRKCLFGDIVEGEMSLNRVGEMIDRNWVEIMKQFSNVELDEFIVMPNHLHGIVLIMNDFIKETIKGSPTITMTLGGIMGAFKSITTNAYIHNVKENHWSPFNKKIWQRGFYDHVIRNEKDLHRVHEYIVSNPWQWNDDEYYM